MNRWTPREDKLLGTDTDAAIAERIGRPRRAVESRRARLKIPAFTSHARDWTESELRLLGTLSDQALAQQLGCGRNHVLHKRQARRIKAYSPANTPRKFRRRKKTTR